MTVLISTWLAKVNTTAIFKQTGGASALGQAQAEARTMPAAFVVLLSESATRNQSGTSFTSQTVTQRVGVVLAVDNKRDRSGEAGMDELETARDAVFTALHGTNLSGGKTPVEFVQGGVYSTNATTQWWMDEFLTTYFRRT